MKRLLIIYLLFTSIWCNAQITNVPYINIERYRNATVEMIFIVKNNTIIQNLSSTELRFKIINGANYAVDSSTRINLGVTNLDSARIRVYFSPTQITRLRGDVYKYEFIKVIGSAKTMLCTGQFRLILNTSATGAPPANTIVINIGQDARSWIPNLSTTTTAPLDEIDPTVAIHIKGITTTEKSNWNTAYGWGNHAAMGYLTSSALQQGISQKMNYSDSTLFARKTTLAYYVPIGSFNMVLSNYANAFNAALATKLDTNGTIKYSRISGTPTIPTVPTNISAFTNNVGYITNSALTPYLLKTDTTGKWKPASYQPTWSQVTSKPTFATVATSGNYNDLSNKPTIPTVPDTTVLLRKTTAAALYQPKGNYQPLGNYQKVYEIDQSDGIFTNMVIRNTTSGEILRLWIGGDTTDTGPNKYKMYVIKGAWSGINDWRMFDVEGTKYLDQNLYGITKIDSSTTEVINSITYKVYIQKFAISKISIGDQDSAGTGRRLIFNYPTNWVFTEQKRWKKKI